MVKIIHYRGIHDEEHSARDNPDQPSRPLTYSVHDAVQRPAGCRHRVPGHDRGRPDRPAAGRAGPGAGDPRRLSRRALGCPRRPPLGLASVAGRSAVLAPVEVLAIAAVAVLVVLARRSGPLGLGGPVLRPRRWRQRRCRRDRPVALVAPGSGAPGSHSLPRSGRHAAWPGGPSFRSRHPLESGRRAQVRPDDATARAPGGRSRALDRSVIARARLAGGFFGLTAVNPVTIVLFATVVVAARAVWGPRGGCRDGRGLPDGQRRLRRSGRSGSHHRARSPMLGSERALLC